MFNYLLLLNGIKINQILKGRVVNSTSNWKSNCSTCICQCIQFNLSSSSSTLCCYANCYTNNDTCQVFISASNTNPVIVIDQTSIVYFVNYSTYTTTTRPSITSTSTNYGSLLIANTVTNNTSTRTSSISVTYITTKTTTP
ncbi:unnamed protein product [Rotaria sp. Silwood2]|nr:unnamed protein product [Rotaria sp. Silwood2]CAF4506351.1 unnamed protein product [Rotaria sp. Silwood2]